MRLTFRGTRSALSSPDRIRTAILLKTDETMLLGDCESSVIHRPTEVATGPDRSRLSTRGVPV